MEPFFITSEAIVPMRKEPKESSEMVSQVLFGEKGEILEERENWVQVKAADDGYRGWVDRQMVVGVSEATYHSYSTREFVLEGKLLLGGWYATWTSPLREPVCRQPRSLAGGESSGSVHQN